MNDGRRTLVVLIVVIIVDGIDDDSLHRAPVGRGEGQLRLVGSGIGIRIGHGDHHIRSRLAGQHHRVATHILLCVRARIVDLKKVQPSRSNFNATPIIILNGTGGCGRSNGRPDRPAQLH